MNISVTKENLLSDIMEQTGFILITVKGKTPEGNLMPVSIDIAETKELFFSATALKSSWCGDRRWLRKNLYKAF